MSFVSTRESRSHGMSHAAVLSSPRSDLGRLLLGDQRRVVLPLHRDTHMALLEYSWDEGQVCSIVLYHSEENLEVEGRSERGSGELEVSSTCSRAAVLLQSEPSER